MLESSTRTSGALAADAGFAAAKNIVETIREWRRRARSRRDLMTLDPRDLRDLRLTRADVMREAGKSFWQE